MKTDFQKTGLFKREERIRRPDDIRKLFKEGKKVNANGAKLFFYANNSSKNRIGFALSRGYGSAVTRNKSKRLSREAYRHLKSHLNTGYDMLILVYPGNESFHSRCELVRNLFTKAGLFLKP